VPSPSWLSHRHKNGKFVPTFFMNIYFRLLEKEVVKELVRPIDNLHFNLDFLKLEVENTCKLTQ